MTYNPKPIDTSKIQLPEDITELRELLADHIHDIWAMERIRQGWSYGEKRDDDKKLHPCLVPYNELTEDEKKFDRETALESIKAIIACGYKIEKK